MTGIKVGLVGAGLLGLTHSFCLKAISDAGLMDVKVTKVYDPNVAAADSLVENLGVEKRVASADEIFDDDNIDTVYITTPTLYHKELVCKAAAAGKNVFCEKPLYINYEGAKEMAAEIEKAKIVSGVGLVLRFSPTLNFILEKINTPDIGRPIFFSIRDDQCLPIKGLHHTTWRVNEEESGGGTLIEHSIHDIDLFSWLFGNIKLKDVDIKYHPEYQGIDNYVRIVAELKPRDGIAMEGILTSIWHDMIGRPSNRRLEIVFDKLFIATDHDFLGPIEITEGDGEVKIVEKDEILSTSLTTLGIVDSKIRDFFMGLDYETFGVYTLEDYFFLKAIVEKGVYSPGFDIAVSAHKLVHDIYSMGNK